MYNTYNARHRERVWAGLFSGSRPDEQTISWVLSLTIRIKVARSVKVYGHTDFGSLPFDPGGLPKNEGFILVSSPK